MLVTGRDPFARDGQAIGATAKAKMMTPIEIEVVERVYPLGPWRGPEDERVVLLTRFPAAITRAEASQAVVSALALSKEYAAARVVAAANMIAEPGWGPPPDSFQSVDPSADWTMHVVATVRY